ncbi:MAG: RNA polymerase sigma factor RpoD/SigA [Bacteroidia bacterium]|nr:RNA polymerase sigma factor RpoD/SigA [Bacteroidia bacterium]
MRQLKIQKQSTNRESQSLDKYLQEIGKVPLLSVDEEAELARRIRQGDEEALEKLVKANLRFVVSVAKQYQNQGLPLTDLISEGNLGLIKAAKRFDETRGFKFISYAVWWIRQSILQALAEQSRIVRLPLNRVGALNKINKVFARLEQEYEREPSPEEIAEAMKGTLSAEEVAEIMRQSGRHVSLDSPIAPGEDTRFIDVLENPDLPQPDQVLMYESLRQEIAKALATLEERESQILRMHFGIDQRYPMTLEEIAEKLGLTRERVRQIKERAIRKLRSNPAVLEPLRQYLG